MTNNTEQTPKLERRLNLLDTTFLVIGSVIGSGIFMTPGHIAEYLPSPALILLVWLIGGLLALCGALAFAELGAMYPDAGGQYIYLREAYGSFAGFFYGWGFFWFIMCGAIASLSVGFAEFLGSFVPILATDNFLFHTTLFGKEWSVSAGQLVAVATVVLLTGVNYVGLREGITVQNILTYLRILLVLAFVVFGLAVGGHSGVRTMEDLLSWGGRSGWGIFGALGLGLVATFWTYDGWYAVNCVAGEIKRPERNIPVGLILGTFSVTVAYLLMNLVYVLALPIDALKGVTRIGELVSAHLFGPTAASVFSAAIMLSIFGCLSATILYGPRVFMAMAEDGLFFRTMARVHPRFHVPSNALIGQAVWSCILCLSGTYQDLYEFVVFAVVFFFAATGLAVIVLRHKQPAARRPYLTWGYPVVPLVFVAANVFVFLDTIWDQPRQSLLGLAILSIGVPTFFFWKRSQKGASRHGPQQNR